MTDVLQLLTDRIRTPIGEMLIIADEDGNLRATDWSDHEARMQRLLRLHYASTDYGSKPIVIRMVWQMLSAAILQAILK
jgi:methylated-DNA-[protein]-cysteine S-methyltransferase